MEPGPEQGTPPAPAPERKQGWFMRLPLWARIAIPVVLVAGAATILIAALLPREPADPVGAAESACRSGVLAEVESHDMSVREVSFFDVTTTEDDVYLATGDVAFRDSADESARERRVQVRCTVRVENGELRAPSIRFSELIDSD